MGNMCQIINKNVDSTKTQQLMFSDLYSQEKQRTDRFYDEQNLKMKCIIPKEIINVTKQTIRDQQSQDDQNLYNSQQYNVRTETETNWVPLRIKISRRIIAIHETKNYLYVYPQEEVSYEQPPEYLQQEDQKNLSKEIEIKDNKEEQTINKSNIVNQKQKGGPQELFKHSQKTIIDNPPDEILDQLPLQMVGKQSLQDENSNLELMQPRAQSLTLLLLPSGQIKNSNVLFRTSIASQNISVDRQLFNTPQKSVLKQRSQPATNRSFRSQKIQTKKQVKFNLTRDFYHKELGSISTKQFSKQKFLG